MHHTMCVWKGGGQRTTLGLSMFFETGSLVIFFSAEYGKLARPLDSGNLLCPRSIFLQENWGHRCCCSHVQLSYQFREFQLMTSGLQDKHLPA